MASSPLNRKKLSEVFHNPELVRAFEGLFQAAANVNALQAQIDAQAIVINSLNATITQLQVELETSRRTNLTPIQQQIDELRTLLLGA